MAKKQFGQQDWIGFIKRRSRGMGYFLQYCDCRAKIYITQEELLALLKKTDFPLPLKEIVLERILRKVRIPKVNLVVEWRRLENLRKIPYGRGEKIAALKRSGWTLNQIGKKFGLTRQRIHQVLKKQELFTAQ